MTQDAIRRLKEIGKDLSLIPINKVPSVMKRICFICCNNYTRPDYSLGLGPISDALTVAHAAQYAGLEIYFLHNPRKQVFIQYFSTFLQNTKSALFFFYVGHGTQVKCDRGDETDGMDEAFVFDDAFLVDDDLADLLIKYKHPNSTTILITDCCHSGSIWDLTDPYKKFPLRIISLSAAADNQTSKQLMIDRIEQGAFTANMYKMLKENLHVSPRQLQPKLNAVLKTYQQSFTIETTSPEMLDEPLFQPVPPSEYEEEDETEPAAPPPSTTTSTSPPPPATSTAPPPKTTTSPPPSTSTATSPPPKTTTSPPPSTSTAPPPKTTTSPPPSTTTTVTSPPPSASTTTTVTSPPPSASTTISSPPSKSSSLTKTFAYPSTNPEFPHSSVSLTGTTVYNATSTQNQIGKTHYYSTKLGRPPTYDVSADTFMFKNATGHLKWNPPMAPRPKQTNSFASTVGQMQSTLTLGTSKDLTRDVQQKKKKKKLRKKQVIVTLKDDREIVQVKDDANTTISEVPEETTYDFFYEKPFTSYYQTSSDYGHWYPEEEISVSSKSFFSQRTVPDGKASHQWKEFSYSKNPQEFTPFNTTQIPRGSSK